MQHLVNQKIVVTAAPQVASHPQNFISTVLPFYHSDITARNITGSIDPNLVIGGTYRDYGNVLVNPAYLNNINQQASSGLGTPIYHKVGDFPLIVAMEGKNRVIAFQQHNINISCNIKQTSYPDPQDLTIHKAWWTEKVYFLRCKKEKFLHRQGEYKQIVYPELIVPLLQKYGVKMGRRIFPFHQTFKSEKHTLNVLSQSLMSN